MRKWGRKIIGIEIGEKMEKIETVEARPNRKIGYIGKRDKYSVIINAETIFLLRT